MIAPTIEVIAEEYVGGPTVSKLTWQRVLTAQSGQFGNLSKYRISANIDGYEQQSYVKIDWWTDAGWAPVYTFHGIPDGLRRFGDEAANRRILDLLGAQLLTIAERLNS